jgi:hypothetical protein
MVKGALVAVGLVAAFAAAQASAALPELGRCEPAGTSGKYKYKNCIIPASGNGAFEFHPGPGAKPKFEASIATPQLQTVGGKKVGCSVGGISGEWTGPKTATITSLAFEGCGSATQHTKCTSGLSGTSISNGNPLEAELGLIVGGEKPVVGLDIRAKSPNTEVLSFQCGTPITEPPAEHWTIEGSVIGSLKPPNRMVSEYKLLYAATNGLQQYQKFEGGGTDVLSAKILNLETLGMTTEQVGLTLKGPEKPYLFLIGEEPLEIKAK